MEAHWFDGMKTVTVAIILRGDDVLLARRGPSEKLAGYWEFPGGKVEEGESLADCLRRELYEELGIIADVGEVIAESEYHYEYGSFLLVAMYASQSISPYLNATSTMIELILTISR